MDSGEKEVASCSLYQADGAGTKRERERGGREMKRMQKRKRGRGNGVVGGGGVHGKLLINKLEGELQNKHHLRLAKKVIGLS